MDRRRWRAWRLETLARHGREIPALALAVIWLFGATFAPFVHLAMHARVGPHTHAAVAAISAEGELVDSSFERCHRGHCHDESEAEPSEDERPTEHGRGCLAHGDAAVLLPGPALVVPPFVPVGTRAEPAPVGRLLDDIAPPRPSARGPPIQARRSSA